MWFLNIIKSPKSTLSQLLEEPKRLKRLFLVSWAYGIILMIAYIVQEEVLRSKGLFMLEERPISFLLESLLMGWSIVYLHAYIINIVSRIFGGKSSSSHTKVITICAAIPIIISVLIIMAVLLLMSPVKFPLIPFLILFIFCYSWHYFILGYGIITLYKFSLLKTIPTIIISFIIFLLANFIISIFSTKVLWG